MAYRKCPLCNANLESYAGRPLRIVAAQHKVIVHREMNPEERAKWNRFFRQLPMLH